MLLTRGRAALLLGLGWTLACALLAWPLMAHYFPLADEWSLLAAADPAITPPSSWFTSGFSDYFVFHPELMAPYTRFARPLFNGTYWLLGLVLAPDSGARLLLNCAVFGLLSALAWLAMTRDGVPARHALPLALALPLLPSLLPALAGLQPFLAFDPLAACLCLAAYLAYQRGNDLGVLAALVAALLTKETALPVAAALPLHALLNGQLRRTALLVLPLLAWALWRWLNFGDLSGGTYTFGGGSAADILRGMLDKAQRWPLWVLAAPAGAGALYKSLHWIMVAANVGLLVCGSLLMLMRLLRQRNLEAAEWCMVASYGLLLLTGVYARFGAVLDAFLVLCIARWLRDSVPLLPRLAAAALAAGVMAYLWPAAQALNTVPAEFAQYQALGRDYVQALRAFPEGRRVLVLNDPVTWHSRLPALKAVMQLPADVDKLADYTCPTALMPLDRPCHVALTQLGERRYSFAQTCGVSICGTRKLADQPAALAEAGARIELPAPMNPNSSNPVWDRYTLELDHGDLDLLYFDPASRSFVTRHVP